ncbi:MAG: hypothetical protein JWN04_2595 [Myxococcaceae bacterium]|nr:hypothetical protein [Myxococcaceae bacterium]
MKFYDAIMFYGAIACAVGCGAGGGTTTRYTCQPLDERCNGDEIMGCELDVDALTKGQHVYVWMPLTDCREDSSDALGTYTCAESTVSNGRVTASCELEEDARPSSTKP